ncbi:MAG TPA: DMT family transporter [Symbiobacteriaceae bacterium]|nr:DMT family transporter [Symbiobacteriaceae bacterium]
MALFDLFLLLILGGLWGGSFIFMRVAAPQFGPVWLIFLRVLIAAGALLVWTVAQRQAPSLKRLGWQYLVLGLIASALPFTLIAWAELKLSASTAAILNAATPLMAALTGALLLGERFGPRRLAGLVLGFIGVVLVVGWTGLTLGAAALLPALASLGACLCYALGAAFTKRAFGGESAVGLATGQQIGAVIAFLPLLPFVERPGAIELGAIWALVALALASTAVAYLIYFVILERNGPTKTLTVTFLVPLFSSVWGALFLSESVGWGAGAGLVLILGSLLLVNEVRLPPFGGRGRRKAAA